MFTLRCNYLGEGTTRKLLVHRWRCIRMACPRQGVATQQRIENSRPATRYRKAPLTLRNRSLAVLLSVSYLHKNKKNTHSQLYSLKVHLGQSLTVIPQHRLPKKSARKVQQKIHFSCFREWPAEYMQQPARKTGVIYTKKNCPYVHPDHIASVSAWSKKTGYLPE